MSMDDKDLDDLDDIIAEARVEATLRSLVLLSNTSPRLRPLQWLKLMERVGCLLAMLSESERQAVTLYFAQLQDNKRLTSGAKRATVLPITPTTGKGLFDE